MARRYLCIVPGMEGHHGRFHLLCDRLKLPAIVLQTGIDHPHETVPQMGQRCADVSVHHASLFYVTELSIAPDKLEALKVPKYNLMF